MRSRHMLQQDLDSRADIDADERRRRLLIEKFGTEEPTRWMHHLVDFESRAKAEPFESPRPLTFRDRTQRLMDFKRVPVQRPNVPRLAWVADRELRPTQPRQSVPLS